jgi:hypothetical protein
LRGDDEVRRGGDEVVEAPRGGEAGAPEAGVARGAAVEDSSPRVVEEEDELEGESKRVTLTLMASPKGFVNVTS